jgi:hypothetical protein
MNERRRRKQGPRDVVDVSWAVGKFFLGSFHFFVINYFFRCKTSYRDDENNEEGHSDNEKLNDDRPGKPGLRDRTTHQERQQRETARRGRRPPPPLPPPQDERRGPGGTGMRDGDDEDDGDGDGGTGRGTRKNGPRDVVDVSWAAGKFFFSSLFRFCVTN